MVPLVVAVNCTPRVTASPSPESGVFGVVESVQMLHGHCPSGGVALAVMKVYVTPEPTCPESSCSPLTDTVSVVPAGSWPFGVNVATVSVLSIDTVPGTLPEEYVTVNETVLDCTGLLNVTVGSVVTRLLDDPG